MKRITGSISFIGSVTWTLLLVYVFFDSVVPEDYVNGSFSNDNTEWNLEELLTWVLLFALCLSGIHYTITSRFWTSKPSVIDALDRENEIIRKQIEKRELLAKLEDLEKK